MIGATFTPLVCKLIIPTLIGSCGWIKFNIVNKLTIATTMCYSIIES